MGLFGSEGDEAPDLSGEHVGNLRTERSVIASELRRVVDTDAGVVLYYVIADGEAGMTAVPIDQTDLDPADFHGETTTED